MTSIYVTCLETPVWFLKLIRLSATWKWKQWPLEIDYGGFSAKHPIFSRGDLVTFCVIIDGENPFLLNPVTSRSVLQPIHLQVSDKTQTRCGWPLKGFWHHQAKKTNHVNVFIYMSWLIMKAWWSSLDYLVGRVFEYVRRPFWRRFRWLWKWSLWAYCHNGHP